MELTDQAALALEGQRLGHCVASYTVKCLLSESTLFSIRDAAGVPLSTFEARVPASGQARLLQHHGAANEAPDRAQQQLAERFVAQVLTQISPAHLRQVRHVRRKLGLGLRHLLAKPDTQPPPLSPALRELLADAIAMVYPAEVRRQGLKRYLAREGDALLQAMIVKQVC